MLRTVVTFQSHEFNTIAAVPGAMNASCFGDDVCRSIIEQLTKDDVRCFGILIAEDFGWCFKFEVDRIKYHFCCGFRPAVDADEGTWIGWIERTRGILTTFSNQFDINPEVLVCVDKAIRASGRMSNILWHDKRTFDNGDEDAGSPDPMSP